MKSKLRQRIVSLAVICGVFWWAFSGTAYAWYSLELGLTGEMADPYGSNRGLYDGSNNVDTLEKADFQAGEFDKSVGSYCQLNLVNTKFFKWAGVSSFVRIANINSEPNNTQGKGFERDVWHYLPLTAGVEAAFSFPGHDYLAILAYGEVGQMLTISRSNLLYGAGLGVKVGPLVYRKGYKKMRFYGGEQIRVNEFFLGMVFDFKAAEPSKRTDKDRYDDWELGAMATMALSNRKFSSEDGAMLFVRRKFLNNGYARLGWGQESAESELTRALDDSTPYNKRSQDLNAADLVMGYTTEKIARDFSFNLGFGVNLLLVEDRLLMPDHFTGVLITGIGEINLQWRLGSGNALDIFLIPGYDRYGWNVRFGVGLSR